MAAITVIAGTAIVISCNNAADAAAEKADAPKNETFTPEQVKHGEYLVSVLVCDDCHSPKIFGPNGPEPDPSRRLSGHPADVKVAPVDTNQLKSWVFFAPDLTAAVGPWGISYSANLTSDSTGIGPWKFEQFKKAIREGKFMGLDGARPLLPPMPWQQYRNLTDEDLRDIFAFLKSTKPVKNVVPEPVPPSQVAVAVK